MATQKITIRKAKAPAAADGTRTAAEARGARSTAAAFFKRKPENTIGLNSYPPSDRTRNTGKIVWLLGNGDNAGRMEYIKRKAFEIDRTMPARINFIQMDTIRFCPRNKATKTTHLLTAQYEETIYSQIAFALQTASCVVVNCFPFLMALLADSTGHGTKETLNSFRGSLYYHRITQGIPSIVIDEVSKCYTAAWKQDVKANADPAASEQFLEFDMRKVWRFANKRQHVLPAFSHQLVIGARKYTTGDRAGSTNYMRACDSIEAQELLRDGKHIHEDEFRALIATATEIAIDSETSMGDITCLSVSAVWNHDPRTVRNFTIPYIDTTAHDTGQLWMTTGSFRLLHHCITQLCVPKIYANGTYDAHYHIKNHQPPVAPVHDIIHMWHSYRARMPKSLATIASIYMDNYYFWKDEIKGGAGEKKTQVSYAVPVTHEGLRIYWRYAALDTYNTLLASFYVAQEIAKPANHWALKNYAREIAMQYGPIMKASYMGCRLDGKRLEQLNNGNTDNATDGLKDLITASAGIVTTGTDAQAIQWIYHTLGAVPPKQKKDRSNPYSVDQKQLTLVGEQHPILSSAIHYLRGYRKPAKAESMYGAMKFFNERFQYKYSIAGTYTGRLSGKSSDFWCGTNPQNIPADMRSFIRADKGMVMFDIDYSQADLYHFAVAVGDRNMITNVFDDRDTHAVHVEMILKRSYDEVVRGKKAGEAWVTDPITGCRQIIKKLTHGGNYGMEGPSAYVNAGRDALTAAANALNIDTTGWQLLNYTNFISDLLRPYFAAYPGQMEFRKRAVQDCIANNGLATCFGGLTVFFQEHGRGRDKQSLMRALLAFYGQGGTAGMINEAIQRMYYRNTSDIVDLKPDARSFLDHYNIDLLLQTHDSMTYQMPIEALTKEPNILKYILHYMEIKCKFNGVEYVVPCEVQIGSRWSKKMPEVKRSASSQDLLLAALDHFIYEKDL